MPNENRKTIREWLSKPYQWIIPVYQRHYAWDATKEFSPTHLFWDVVKEQAERRIKDETPSEHYFGAILVQNVTDQTKALADGIQRLHVVDGQQRLTTLNVAMFALIAVAMKHSYRDSVQGDLERYIFLPNSGNQCAPKLSPTNFDRAQYNKLLDFVYPQEDSYDDSYENEYYARSKIVQAIKFFKDRFALFLKENCEGNEADGIEALKNTILDGFELILITLQPKDEAQKVFESLNNTSQPLTTFDLIRNNVFYRAHNIEPGSDVTLFNSDRWQQFEDPFWDGAPRRADKNTHIEAYIARMLTAKLRKYILLNRNSIVIHYKDLAETFAGDVRKEIKSISEYVDVYKFLMGESNKNPIKMEYEDDEFELDFGFFMYKQSKNLSFYPVLFAIVKSPISVKKKQAMIYLLESFVIRRSICHLPDSDYNKQAASICKRLGLKPNYEKLDDYLKESKDDTRRFPKNKHVTECCRGMNSYERKAIIKYVFERIIYNTTTESNEKRDMQGLTLDHIIPQGWREKDGWSKLLTKELSEIAIDSIIHTIGNLTPMSKGLNSSKSNRAWIGERGAKKWLLKCDLTMTRELGKKPTWGIADVDNRSNALAKIICGIWEYDITI